MLAIIMRSEPKKKTSPAKESPKAAGSDPAGSPAFSLKDWSMGATLLESVVEADSWKLRLVRGSWTVMWHAPDDMKPQFADLKISKQEVEEDALCNKIRAEIKEERKLMQLVKDQEDPQKPADLDTKAAEAKVKPSRKPAPTEAESKPIIAFLAAHITRPEFTCRVRWRRGGVTVWDNRVTQHCALNDYQGKRRRMRRVTLKGDRPQ